MLLCNVLNGPKRTSMSSPSISTTKGVAKLRLLLASIIADHYKSYEVPTLCERLGLEAGTEGEAFSSKRLYFQKRLQKLSVAEVNNAARELATEIDNPELNLILEQIHSPSDGAISETLLRFDVTEIHARWTSALERRTKDPEGAITLSRTLLEDVCKWLLTEQATDYADKDDLPQLYRKVANNMNLAPDAHTEDIFKRILGSCQSVVESLGTMRNKLGDAHSSGPLKARPLARHAELAVNLSGAMATFLVATWEARKS